jgi:hypothetical protein
MTNADTPSGDAADATRREGGESQQRKEGRIRMGACCRMPDFARSSRDNSGALGHLAGQQEASCNKHLLLFVPLSRCPRPPKMRARRARSCLLPEFGGTKPTGENESAHSSRKEVRSRVGNGGFDVAHAPCKLSRHVDSPAGSTSDEIHINPVDHGRSASRLYERPRREPRGQSRSGRCPPCDRVLPQSWQNEASALTRHMITLSARSLAERSQQRSLRTPRRRNPTETGRQFGRTKPTGKNSNSTECSRKSARVPGAQRSVFQANEACLAHWSRLFARNRSLGRDTSPPTRAIDPP